MPSCPLTAIDRREWKLRPLPPGPVYSHFSRSRAYQAGSHLAYTQNPQWRGKKMQKSSHGQQMAKLHARIRHWRPWA